MTEDASKNASYPWLKRYPDAIDWNTRLVARPLYRLLDEAERQWPNSNAIDFMGRHFTYKEVADYVRKLATGLTKLGVKRGVKVGLCLPNCPQFVIAYYAILKAGGTVVNYSPLYNAQEIGHQINDSGTEIMITLALEALYPKVKENLGSTKLKLIVTDQLANALPLAKRLAFPILKRGEISEIPNDAQHVSWESLLNNPPQHEPVAIQPEADVAVIQYTGGTTGVPKGAVLTHANLYVNAHQCGMWFPGATPGKEKVLGVLPLFHVFAMATVMNFSILKGAEMILHPRFEIKSLLADIHGKKPTLMPGVSTLFAAINQYRHLDKYNLKSLKYCISGGGPLPQEVKKQFEERTGCILVEGYGLSEASPVTNCNPLTGTNKTGSIGMPLPGTIVEVVDLDDRSKVLGVRETGEICVRGPQVMHGYWQQLTETNDTIIDGRLHTGDVGYYDEDGYFYIVDRLKELIISGGFNIYPRTVEEAVYKHDAIAECAVIGIEHPKRGEVPKVCAVLVEGKKCLETELTEFLKGHLPTYAVPRHIEFCDSLPKTMVGKVDKRALKKAHLSKKTDEQS